jgi:hypothetical protein
MSKNIMTLYPYKIDNTWVFDDERTRLKEEAFVLGMSEIISEVVQNKNLPNPNEGFDMIFSDNKFDGFDAIIIKEYPESGGTWYSGNIFGNHMRGWLCPALFLYFKEAPLHIYMKADPLSPNVDPKWTPDNIEMLGVRQFYAAPH